MPVSYLPPRREPVSSYLETMFNADPQPRLTPESIRDAERGAAEQTRLTDEANAKLRAARGEDHGWRDELDYLERRFASVGTVHGTKADVERKNAEHDVEVTELEELRERLETALADPNNFHAGTTIRKRLEKIAVKLEGARHRQELWRRLGEQQIRGAKDFEKDLPRLRTLRAKDRQQDQLNAQLQRIR